MLKRDIQRVKLIMMLLGPKWESKSHSVSGKYASGVPCMPKVMKRWVEFGY